MNKQDMSQFIRDLNNHKEYSVVSFDGSSRSTTTVIIKNRFLGVEINLNCLPDHSFLMRLFYVTDDGLHEIENGYNQEDKIDMYHYAQQLINRGCIE